MAAPGRPPTGEVAMRVVNGWVREILVRKYVPQDARVLEWWVDVGHIGKLARLERKVEHLTVMGGEKAVAAAAAAARKRRADWTVSEAVVATHEDDVFPKAVVGDGQQYNCVSCLSEVLMESLGVEGVADAFLAQLREVLADGGVCMTVAYDTAVIHRQAVVESPNAEATFGNIVYKLEDAAPPSPDRKLFSLKVHGRGMADRVPVLNLTTFLRMAEARGFEVVEARNARELLSSHMKTPPWNHLLYDYGALDQNGRMGKLEASVIELFTTVVLRKRRLPETVWTPAALCVPEAAAPPPPPQPASPVGSLAPEDDDDDDDAGDMDMDVDIPW
eukprot:TRINITY_DN21999_c0_g1_i1.p2 TRINITY_DN21999_c0_g1~~TRINITY_DN21999_c0_g1_i1.p2  ORF type:complete len:332 (+),score=118.77 TRINITY_DN21999_c0_g1_i1:171-1166(+)